MHQVIFSYTLTKCIAVYNESITSILPQSWPEPKCHKTLYLNENSNIVKFWVYEEVSAVTA